MTDQRFGPQDGEDPIDWALGYRLYLEAEGFTRLQAKEAEAALYGWAEGIDPDGHRDAFIDLAADLSRYHRVE